MMRKRGFWLAVLSVLLMVLAAGTGSARQNNDSPAPPDNIAIIMDASGSMRQFIGGGELRVDVAKDAISELAAALPEGVDASLWAYGHRLSQDDPAASCRDIEEVIPLGPVDAESFSQTVQSLNAIGYTPIADTLQQVALSLPSDENNLVVLMSDGEESCGGDPCAVAAALAQSGANLVVNTIGFAADTATRAQLECIADASSGTYFEAQDAPALFDSFQQASQPQLTLTPVATDTPQNTPTLLPTGTPGPTTTLPPSPTPPATITPITPTPTITPVTAELQEGDLPFSLSSTAGIAVQVQAAVDQSGRLHVLWLDAGFNGYVHRLRTPDGLWSAAKVVASGTDFAMIDRASGRLVSRQDGAMCTLVEAIPEAGAGEQVFFECFLENNWRGQSSVLAPGPNRGVEAAHASDNSLQIVFIDRDGNVIHTNSETELNDGGIALDANLSIDSNWNYHISYVNREEPDRVLHRYTRDNGVTWTEPEAINGELPVDGAGTLFTDLQSRVHAAFNSDGDIYYRWWSPDTGWSDFTSLSGAAGGAFTAVTLAVGLDGVVHAAWSGPDGLFYARQVSGAWDAEWLPPVLIDTDASAGVTPALAVDPQGVAHLIYADTSETPHLVYTRP